MDAEAPPDPRVGNLLQGRYRILHKLASGAMGIVYKGERVELGRAVAVKFLHPWIAAQKTFIDRFSNEAKAMSRLLHPNCVSVIDFGVEGSPYLVMDFVTGRTLRDMLLDGGQISTTRALRITQQLLSGLAYAHAQGIVHRDLKPENLILSDEPGLEEHLRILDFGLAKLRDGPAMTAGLAVGTPSYMSPEQSGAEGAIDARTDLYTVGVVLFELLSGKKPFVSDNVGEIILMHREAPPPLLRKVAPAGGHSLELELLLQKAMAKRQEDRFQSAAEMAAALDALPEAHAPSAPARPVPGPPPGRPTDATTVDTISAVRRRIDEIKAPRTPRPQPRQWRLTWFGAGFLLIAMLALLIGRALFAPRPPQLASGGAPHGASAPAAASAPSRPPAPGGENPQLEEARGLVARGQVDQAIAVLNRLRVEHPDDAEAPYLLAMIYFDHRRWPDGLAAAQVAVQKNPTLKSDPDLIKGSIASLVSDRGYERSQGFLRSLGAPATPFIKTAAHRDANPKVRDRAADLLEGGGRGWSGRPSSSGGSVFKR